MKHKWTILALVVAMVGALLATAGIAAGAGEGDDPVLVPRGWLLLDTSDNSSFSVTWYGIAETEEGGPKLGDELGAQTFSVDNKCNLETPTGDNLIAITQTGSTFGATGIGALSHGLGVKTKNNCSTEQGQIVLGQTLTIALGSAFDNTYFIKSAEVDVEGKRNAKLGVAYSPGGSENITLTNTSDNGPDSGPADNNIALLGSESAPFRSVTLQPVANGSNGPAISIEGGGDGAVTGGTLRGELGTNASVFELVQEFDGLLNCGQSVTEGDLNGENIRVLRGGQAGCVLKPYNIDYVPADEFGVSFVPSGPADSDPETDAPAEFTATIVWPAETAELPVPATLIDFDGPGVGEDPEPVQWCTGTAIRNPEDGTLATNPEDDTDELVDFAFVGPPGLPSDGAPWCLLDQDVTYVNGGDMQVTEYYYGRGVDPFMDR